MTEPPTKRARRVDSSTMWELNDRRTHSPTPTSEYDRSPRRESYAKDDGGRRDGPRDNRRYRSRSRQRRDRRWERSRSRDRRDRDRRDRDRDGRGARDKERSISRDRHHDRRGYPAKGDRLRDRSRSPIRKGARDRSRTPPPRGPRADRRQERRDFRLQPNGATDTNETSKDDMDVDEGPIDEDDIDAAMRKYMGFNRFRSTKNTQVPGNDVYGVRKEKKTEYRQYMNRMGGFNRPLSP